MAPLIVTLGFDPETFDRLDALRRRYFPPDRNVVPAHVSLFHALPAEEWEVMASTLTAATLGIGPIPLRFSSLKRLGRGMAVAIEAPGLAGVHRELARAFSAWLTPQDRQPFRPHVTIMNKAEPAEAEAAFAHLGATWEPWTGIGTALLLWSYRGGPWEAVAEFPLAGDSGRTAASSEGDGLKGGSDGHRFPGQCGDDTGRIPPTPRH